MKVEFFGKVISGNLELSDKEGFRRHYRQFEGFPVSVMCDRAKNTRTNAQNAYYWGVVIETVFLFIREHNQDMEENQLRGAIHEFHKREFSPLSFSVVDANGEIHTLGSAESSTKKTTVSFMEWVELIQVYWAQMGCFISDPGQQEWLEG